MRVIIIGLNHQIQPQPIRSIGAELQQVEGEQKQRFAEMMREIIQQEQVDFVGEEGERYVPLIAEGVARQAGRQHKNVDMPLPERHHRGIPDDYLDPNRGYSPQLIDNWNGMREDHMVEGVHRRSWQQRHNSRSLWPRAYAARG